MVEEDGVLVDFFIKKISLRGDTCSTCVSFDEKINGANIYSINAPVFIIYGMSGATPLVV